MILCDRDIRIAIRDGNIIVTPQPEDFQFAPSALDIRVGDDFVEIDPEFVEESSLKVAVDLESFKIADIKRISRKLPDDRWVNGCAVLNPGELVLVRTYEYIHLPLKSQIAARVEGRSSYARLGLTVHMTAPTVHTGFRGKLTLEVKNHGVLPLHIKPNTTRLCQLVFERLSSTPDEPLVTDFLDQPTPLA